APTGLQAHVVSPTRVDLEWRADPSDAEGFAIYRSASGSDYIALGTVGAGLRSFTDTAAPGGASLTYTVAAFNGRGSASSEPVSVTTPLDPATQLHVASLVVTIQQTRQKGRLVYRAVAKARVVDARNAPAANARVSGVFSGATAAGVTGPTQPDGSATFGSLWQAQRRGAVYT